MLKRIILALTVAAVGMVSAAWADDDDHIMGNYEGTISGKGWETKTIRAQVMAMSKIAWRINLFIGDGSAETQYKLEAKLDQKAAAIDANTELGNVTGRVKDEVFNGEIKGGKGGKGGNAQFSLKRVIIQPPSLGKPVPEGGISLLDGTNIAENWVRTPEQWCMQDDGSMEVCTSNLKTRQEFGDAEFHIEFMTPFKSNARDQERGNSGCYFMGRYEVQVLDSFGEEPRDNWCGGIYKKAKPLVAASLPPLTWQTYDVTMIAPKFDASGNKISDAEITVYHNGLLIHDKLKLDSPTPGGLSGEDGPTGPLMLQNHDNPVRYKNIWVRPLK